MTGDSGGGTRDDGVGGPAEASDADAVVRGQAPSPQDDYWRAAAKELTPKTFVERIDSKAAFVFGNVTLVGTILAGLGVLTDTTGGVLQHPRLALAVLVLTLLSVLCALLAVLPSLRSKLDPADLGDVSRFLQGYVRTRGWLTRSALVLFCAALVAAAVLLFLPRPTPEPTLALQWKMTGQHRTGVVARVSVRGLPEGSTARSVLVALPTARGGGNAVLAEEVAYAGGSGSIATTIQVEDVPPHRAVRLTCTVVVKGAPKVPRRLELTP